MNKPAIDPKRLAEVLSAPLLKGAHEESSKRCVMEAVAYVAGEKHTDSPVCSSVVMASFMRAWNDSLDDKGREMLKPFIEKLVGSAGDYKLEQKRGLMVASWYLTVFTPTWLELAGLTDHANALKAATVASWRDVEKMQPALSAAESAARSAAESAAWSAAESAAWSAAESAAWSAAWSAARSAAESAAWSAAEEALKPTVTRLQESALDLLRQCLTIE